MKKGGLYIGTSGWMYKDWGAAFYPEGMKKGFLTYLAGEFNTVEVNNSFYHLPLSTTFTKWKSETPDDFVFAVKLSRYVTHNKVLTGNRTAIYRFLTHAKRLEGKLGPILVQLPPWKKFEEKEIARFIEDLSVSAKRAGIPARFALEPRHASWMIAENAPQARAILKKHKVALVFPHSAKIASFPPERENVLTDFVYVRFHGPSEFAASRYGKRGLAEWGRRIRAWQREGLRVYVYFNNDVHGHAVHDARDLKELIGSTPRIRDTLDL
jgi:uncharacterized protein YecE (DUF72 family)